MPALAPRRRVPPSVSRRDLGPEIGITAGTVALTTVVYWLIVFRLDARPPLVLFVATAGAITFWRGFGPGLLASTLGTFVGSILSTAQFSRFPGLQEHVPFEGLLLFTGSMFSSWLIYRVKADRENDEDHQRRRDDALAFVSHELRQPLSSIQLAAALLERDQSEEGRSRATKLIVRSAARLGRVVDDLADVAKLQAESIAVNLTAMRLQDAVLAATEALAPAIERRQQYLDIDVPPTPALWIRGDDLRLQQVFTNLLSNASKYSPEGAELSVSLREEHGVAVVVVRDTGVGIQRDVLERIFDPFVRGSNGSADGLGIGLTLARHLVTRHGGRVTAHSEGMGRGSSFVVELPLLPADPNSP